LKVEGQKRDKNFAVINNCCIFAVQFKINYHGNYLFISTKTDSIGCNEILIRYKSGKFAARAKSSVYTLPEWYNFVVGNQSKTIYKGKRIVTDEMKEMQSYHEKQKTKLSEINIIIGEELKIADRNNSDWLKDCIEKHYQRGKYTPKESETKKTPTLLEYTAEFINEYPERIHETTTTKFSQNSIKPYRTLQKHLTEFCRIKEKSDYELVDIDKRFYTDFVKFLQNKDFKVSSIGKYVKALRAILYRATDEKHYYLPEKKVRLNSASVVLIYSICIFFSAM
jgi:hypothetical protein